MLRLSAFALRRSLPLWAFAGLLALLLLAARASEGLALIQGDEGSAAALRALARQNVWSVLLVFAPLLFLQAARLGTSHANDWLAPTPAPALGRAAALALGCALACGAATLLTALVSEASTEGAHAAWRRARAGESPAAVLLDDQPRVRWSMAAPSQNERLRLWTTIAAGAGPAVTARFSARAVGATATVEANTVAANPGAATTVEARVAGRTALELAVPDVRAARLELELERVGNGALLVLPPGALEVLAPVASERRIALALGLRTLVFLATGCALALGLARWLRPALCAGLVLTLALFSWTCAGAERLVPGADLPRAWRELTAGLVPAGLPASALAGAFALAGLGILLQAGFPAGQGRRP